MNTIDFSHSGGFPLETDTLDFLQTNITQPINALAALGGNNYIISGVEDQGFRTSDGWVVIDGEILYFKGDLKQTSVIVVQTGRKVHFQDGKEREVYLNRYVTFGTGLKSIPFASLPRISDLQKQKKRADELQTNINTLKSAHDQHVIALGVSIQTLTDQIKTLQQKSAPFINGGGMVLWQKPANEIPQGWREVTNWRGRMPVGWNPNDSDFNALGKTGGSKQVIIDRTHLPNVPLETNVFYNSQDYVDGGAWPNNIGTNNNGNPVKTKNMGDGTPLAVMNPYRIVMFIEYTGN